MECCKLFFPQNKRISYIFKNTYIFWSFQKLSRKHPFENIPQVVFWRTQIMYMHVLYTCPTFHPTPAPQKRAKKEHAKACHEEKNEEMGLLLCPCISKYESCWASLCIFCPTSSWFFSSLHILLAAQSAFVPHLLSQLNSREIPHVFPRWLATHQTSDPYLLLSPWSPPS